MKPIIAAVVLSGFVLSLNLVRLGLTQSLDLYGAPFTVISGLGVVAVFLALASLADRHQGPPRP